MGTAPSNIIDSNKIRDTNTDLLESSRDLAFGSEQQAKIMAFFEKHKVNDGTYGEKDN
jgi:hypothetical protein